MQILAFGGSVRVRLTTPWKRLATERPNYGGAKRTSHFPSLQIFLQRVWGEMWGDWSRDLEYWVK